MNILHIEHKKYIGGRYSIFSEVGMVPAYIMGLNIQKIKENVNILIKSELIWTVLSCIGQTQSWLHQTVCLNLLCCVVLHSIERCVNFFVCLPFMISCGARLLTFFLLNPLLLLFDFLLLFLFYLLFSFWGGNAVYFWQVTD